MFSGGYMYMLYLTLEKICTFHKIFGMLLGYTVAKASTSPRKLTWFTRLFLLVRGWDLGTRLCQTYDTYMLSW